MLHPRTAIQYGVGTAAAITPPVAGVDTSAGAINEPRRLAAELAVDEVLADSFPASDPPSWTPGIVRLRPSNLDPRAARSEPHDDIAARSVSIDTLDVSRPKNSDRTFLQSLVSLAGSAGLALLVPFAFVLVGLPVVFAVRGVLDLIAWIFGVALQ